MFPNELIVVLNAAIVALVTEGLKALSAAFGKDLTGYGSVIAAAIVSIIVFSFNTIVAILPKDWQASVAAFLALLLTFLSAGGMFKTVKRFAK